MKRLLLTQCCTRLVMPSIWRAMHDIPSVAALTCSTDPRCTAHMAGHCTSTQVGFNHAESLWWYVVNAPKFSILHAKAHLLGVLGSYDRTSPSDDASV
eukprot:4117007-Amphidinium_carterae.1